MTLYLFLIVLLTGLIVETYGENNSDSSVVLKDEDEGYQRKYILKIPEPLLCFPGFQDKLTALENATLLDDLYNFKLVKPADLFPVLATVSLPIYVSMKIVHILLRYSDTVFLPNLQLTLINVKLDYTVAKTEIIHLKAKLETIHNRLMTVNNDEVPQDVKKMEFTVALDKCEEILFLFLEKDHIFYNNPHASLPFFVLFSGPYKTLLEVGSGLIPSKADVFSVQLNKLRDAVDDYKTRTVEKRIEGVLFEKKTVYPSASSFASLVWKKRVVPYDYEITLIDKYEGRSSCSNYQVFETLNETVVDELEFKYMEEYKHNLSAKYQHFFDSPKQAFSPQEDCPLDCEKSSANGFSTISSLMNFASIIFFGLCVHSIAQVS